MLRYLHRLREAGRGWHRQRPASSSARQNDLICAASAVKTDPAICIPIGGSRSLSRLRPVTDYGQAAAWRRCGPPGGRVPGPRGLPGGGRDVGGDDVGRVPVQAAAGPVIPHRRPRVCMRGGLLHVAQRHPGIESGGDEGVSQRVGRDGLADPGAADSLGDDPPGAVPVESSPIGARNTGLSVRSRMARSSARAVRGARGMVTIFPPLRVIVSVRCPRSRPRCSMSAPVASETRSPFSASSEISACLADEPSPAATSSAPSSLRSSATAWDS